MNKDFPAPNRVDMLNAIITIFPAARHTVVMSIIGDHARLMDYLATVNDLTQAEAVEVLQSRLPDVMPQDALKAA